MGYPRTGSGGGPRSAGGGLAVQGTVMNLHDGSPALLQKMFRARWTEMLWTEALGPKLRAAATTQEIRDLTAHGMDQHMVRKLVMSKAKAALTHPCQGIFASRGEVGECMSYTRW